MASTSAFVAALQQQLEQHPLDEPSQAALLEAVANAAMNPLPAEEEELSAGESGSSAQRRSRGDGGIAGDDEEGDDDAYDPGELEEDAEEF